MERNLIKKVFQSQSQLSLSLPTGFPKKKSDQYLFLKNNPKAFESWIDKNRKKMESIRHLDLSSCFLTEIPEALLNALPALETLELSDNPIKLSPENFIKNRNLKEISYFDARVALIFEDEVLVPRFAEMNQTT